MSENKIEVFVTYKDHFPAGTFYVTIEEVASLLKKLEKTSLEQFSIGEEIFTKKELNGVRINGNIGIEFDHLETFHKDNKQSLQDLITFIED